MLYRKLKKQGLISRYSVNINRNTVIVTACSTPWPFNYIAAESRGAIRAVNEVLHYGGYKLIGKIVKSGTKARPTISNRLLKNLKPLEIDSKT